MRRIQPDDPRQMTIDDAALALNVSPATLYKVIRAEVERNTPDDLRFCPGGRCEGQNFYVNRAKFEFGMSSQAMRLRILEEMLLEVLKRPAFLQTYDAKTMQRIA